MVAIIGAGQSARAQSNQSQRALLEQAVQSFGEQKYGQAQSLLEQVVITDPAEAPLVYFYLGACYEETNNLDRAKRFYQKASHTKFNNENAVWRLSEIAKIQNDPRAAEQYQAQLTAISDDLRRRNPELRQAADSRGLVWAVPHVPAVLAAGDPFMRVGKFEMAARAFEYSLAQLVPLPDRFSTGDAAGAYKQLAEAYHQQAGDPTKLADDVAEIEMLARHNELRLLIVQSRIGKKFAHPASF